MSIRVENVTKKFTETIQGSSIFKKEKREIVAINNLNIVFQKGKINGLIGFNGSGKTTTFNVITNLLEKFEGNVYIDDHKITADDRRKFSYLSAGSEHNNVDRASEHFQYIGAIYGMTKDEINKKVQELSVAFDFVENLNKRIKNLSKGNQQKVKVITSMLNPHTEYMFLDEPFDGFDPIVVKKVKQYILGLRGKVTVIITSHRMEIVDAMCDIFFILRKGDLVYSKDKSEATSIFVSINKEVDLTPIKNNPHIISISDSDKEHIVEIDKMASFKEINEILIADKKYIYSSLKQDETISLLFDKFNNEETEAKHE